jgi:UPF0716 family protein affecting phage T7 exclusion
MQTIRMVFLWFLLEFLFFFKLVTLYGFLNVFACYTLPSIIGFIILAYYPKAILASLQNTMKMQEKPSSKIIHSLLITISAIFFIIPSVTTRLIALVLFLPVSRHLLVFFILWQWIKLSGKFFNKFQNFNFSSNGFSAYTGFYTQNGFTKNTNNNFSKIETDTNESFNEDNIIDVTPTHVETTDNKKNKN